MPRANRHFLPGHVWHITHRCHEKNFLLKFAHDRRRYLRWVFEAKKRFGLSVLDYMVTCNHIHLLIKDTGPNVIARSMQLIAGRTAQEYNQRKTRQGAFWEDRYHATAIETDEHLHRCLVYIDLNMVRAGVVDHPGKWEHSSSMRDARRSEAVAVGSLTFVEKIKGELGVKALHREVEQLDGSYALRDPGEAYSGHFHIENEALNVENTLPWERIGEVPAT